ncbi:hypothetical protein [Mucisphaera calidilacus]|nr:hypothetical protein [Mucisphaera calidilacus]
MTRLEELDEVGLSSEDTHLIFSWIALNSLYGTWDPVRQEPEADRASLDRFNGRLFTLDQDKRLESMLVEHKKLVKAIVSDEHLSKYFWRDPGEGEAKRARYAGNKTNSLYVEKRYPVILDMVLQRVYLARCQLVHGAATYKSRLNRTALRRTGRFLHLYLIEASLILIDHAGADGWDDLCYPPTQ